MSCLGAIARARGVDLGDRVLGLVGLVLVLVLASSIPVVAHASRADSLAQTDAAHAYYYDVAILTYDDVGNSARKAVAERGSGSTVAPATPRGSPRVFARSVAPRALATGGARVSRLGDDVAGQVDGAIERAAQGKIRFPGHDGKVFANSDGLLPRAGSGYYTEWTAAAAGAKRGAHRVIVGGNPAKPDVIYYWDHAGNYVQVWP